MSGSALSSWALSTDPIHYSTKLARTVNCTVAENLAKNYEDLLKCLRQVPIKQLMKPDIEAPRFLSAFAPSIDGVTIEDEHEEMLWKRKDRASKYDIMLGIVKNEGLSELSENQVGYGFEILERNRIFRTYVRNVYEYHLKEIYATIVNEYTDWEKSITHPVNIRDNVLQMLADAKYVAPLMNVALALSKADAKYWLYVFNYVSKNRVTSQVRITKILMFQIFLLKN